MSREIRRSRGSDSSKQGTRECFIPLGLSGNVDSSGGKKALTDRQVFDLEVTMWIPALYSSVLCECPGSLLSQCPSDVPVEDTAGTLDTRVTNNSICV